MPTENEQKWIIEQYKSLEDERASFDRYLWQVPIGSIGIIALLLNAIFTFGKGSLYVCMGSFLSAALCLYAALLVGRLHERKSKRCTRMLILEKKMGVGTTIFDPESQESSEPEYKEDAAEKFVNKAFGSTSTAVLGVAALLVVAVIAAICCFVSLCLML